MEKLKKLISENKIFIVIMAIGYILLLIQMNQVVLYADDFSLGYYVKPNVNTDILSYFIEHYTEWGGGYTGILVILFFKVGTNTWKIINTLLIAIMVGLGSKMATYKSENKNSRSIVAAIMWFGIFFLGIYTAKETIYWLDGSVAYILSTFEMFIFIYAIYSKLIMKTEIKKYDYVLLPILGLFSGWSSAQTGIMSLFIAGLIIIYSKIKDKEKIKKIIWVAIAFCIIGCMIFYLSPGNSGRMDTFQDYSNMNIIEKILYRVDGVYGLLFDFKTYETAGLPFYTLLMLGMVSVIGIQVANKEENKTKKTILQLFNIGIIIFLFTCLVMALNLPNIESIQKKFFMFKNLYIAYCQKSLYLSLLMPYMITSAVMLMSLIIAIYIAQKEKNILLPIILLSGYFTQGIMVMAPYSPLRTTFTTIMFFIIAIGYLCYISLKYKYSILLAFAIPLTVFNAYWGIVLIVTYAGIYSLDIDKSKNDKIIITILLVFGMAAMSNALQIYMGYKDNKIIYNENISRLENFVKENPTVESQKDKELVLLLPKDEKYGFTAMTGIDWIDTAIKKYFDIDQSVVLKGQEYKENI